jgi:hypothetical protein
MKSESVTTGIFLTMSQPIALSPMLDEVFKILIKIKLEALEGLAEILETNKTYDSREHLALLFNSRRLYVEVEESQE